MKKALSLFSALTLVLLLLAPKAFAESTHIEGSALCTLTQNDMSFDISFSSSDVENYEETRLLFYDGAKKSGLSDEQIAENLFYSWTLYLPQMLCKVTVNGTEYNIKTVDAKSGKMSLTLFEDILPCLVKNNAFPLELQNGFDFGLSVIGIVDIDGNIENISENAAELGIFSAPATVYIEYDLPLEADNKDNPIFLFAPLLQDIPLKNPTRTGFTFKGWVNSIGIGIDTIPKNTQRMKIGAGWASKTVKAAYILTTRSGHDFTKCNNPNPFVFSSEVGLYLLSPSVPKGWIFEGWFENESLEGEPITRILPGREGDVMLYAKWITEDEFSDRKIKEEKWGDLNDDGQITAADARIALRAAVGLDKLSYELLSRVDFEGVRTIHAGTARTLLRVAVGLDSMKAVLKSFGHFGF